MARSIANLLHTTLVPRLTWSTASSAWPLSVKEAWKAVCTVVSTPAMESKDNNESRTGNNKLMTLRLSKQALIWVTVLL